MVCFRCTFASLFLCYSLFFNHLTSLCFGGSLWKCAGVSVRVTFLRNHDELTLEMVSEEEREFMWDVYAKDPRMKSNLG